MRDVLLGLTFSILCLSGGDGYCASREDAAFDHFADDFINAYLAWRPAEAVSLGLHEFDGRVSDFSRQSLDAELARLKQTDRQLGTIAIQKLSPRAACDYRLLQATVRKALFQFEHQKSYTRNPMTYAGTLDVNIYI